MYPTKDEAKRLLSEAGTCMCDAFISNKKDGRVYWKK